MSYVVMARKWRPQTFDSVVGQAHIVRTLKNALQANRISHAYLFTGPRGVGKTTTARLLAKAVNCLSPVEGEPCNHCVRCEEIVSGGSLDVIEIDAASNGLVDDARELREKVRYAPVACRYKVLIIDEVHMMSNAAFNALLKTLEEPPAHTIFILATTEAHKVPATITSRCQRFDFRRIPVKEMVERLSVMAAAESITADDEALHLIARGADGSLRDAQSLFDQVVSFSGAHVQAQDIAAMLGLVDTQVFAQLVDAIAAHDSARALDVIDQLVNTGADLRLFMKDWVEYWRQLVVAAVMAQPDPGRLDLAQPAAEAVLRQAKLFPLEELLAMARLAATADDELRRTQHPRILLELLLLRLCSAERVVSLALLWQQLQALENRWASGVPMPPAAAAPPFVPLTEAPEPESGPVPPANEAGAPAITLELVEERPGMLAKVQEVWDQVLQAVGQQNRRVQALLRDVTLSQAEEGWVELSSASPYHLSGLEKEEAKKLIEAVLAAELKRPTRLRFKSTGAAVSVEPGEPQGSAAREKEMADLVRQEPLVQKTLELFGGRIVEVIPKSNGGK